MRGVVVRPGLGVVRSGLGAVRSGLARPPPFPPVAAVCAPRALLSSHRWEPFAPEPAARLAPPMPSGAASALLALVRAEPTSSAACLAGMINATPSGAPTSTAAAQRFQLSWSSAEAVWDGTRSNAGLCGGLLPVISLELSSTKKKRKLKMNRHKVKKRRKKDRFKNKV